MFIPFHYLTKLRCYTVSLIIDSSSLTLLTGLSYWSMPIINTSCPHTTEAPRFLWREAVLDDVLQVNAKVICRLISRNNLSKRPDDSITIFERTNYIILRITTVFKLNCVLVLLNGLQYLY